MAHDLIITPEIAIAADELEFSFVRSRGPGGQNVNKVNSKAVLRWRVVDSGSLSDALRGRFLGRYSSRITAAGEIVLSSDEHREQSRNRRACLDKLASLVVTVLSEPRQRKRTRPSRSAVERRLRAKKQRSRTKQDRRASRRPLE
ncbi:MAG: alternative ribosome rescue aminoacyl-tRNA hydrolase ArfB [Planctomycetota bacterium]